MKASKAAINALGTVIAKLEAWQHRHDRHDPARLSTSAKNELMRLLRDMEASMEENK